MTTKRVNKSYKNGDRYEGEMKNGSKDGYGTYFFADGRKYVGDWTNGRRNGLGKQYYRNGKLQYSGSFRMDKKQGFGEYTYQDGRRYEGEWLNNKPNGRGKQFLANGELIFEGKFKDGKKVESALGSFVKNVASGVKNLFVKEEKKVEVSEPKGFIRAAHIGYQPGKGFVFDQGPNSEIAGWEEYFTKYCGFTEDMLKDDKTAKLMVKTIKKFEKTADDNDDDDDDDSDSDAPPPPVLNMEEMNSHKAPLSEENSEEINDNNSPKIEKKVTQKTENAPQNFLDEIKRGRKLKSVKERKLNPVNMTNEQKNDLMSMLKKSIAQRKQNMFGKEDKGDDESSNDTSDEEEWSD